MPAYNVSKYIAKTLDSIIEQTYSNWELIISDDCSTDNTVDIIKEYQKKHSNIRLIKEKNNHCGARIPRYNAILAAKGEYICPIDADDYIEAHFLEKLIKKKEMTNADIVLCRMIICNEDLNRRDVSIPRKDYNINEIMTGIEACRRTIGGWQIAMAGLLTKRKLYIDFIQQINITTFSESFADEIDQRKFLLWADNIAITDAHYFYRQQPNSVVHTTSLKAYNSLITNKTLLYFVIETFKDDKSTMEKMYNEYIEKVYRAQQNYSLKCEQYKKEEKVKIKELIKQSYKCIKEHNMVFHGWRNKVLGTSLSIFRLYTYIVTLYIKLVGK